MKQYKPKEVIKILKQEGFVKIKQRGSHISFFNFDTGKMTILPFHNKDLKTGTLLSILKQAGLSKDDLL